MALLQSMGRWLTFWAPALILGLCSLASPLMAQQATSPATTLPGPLPPAYSDAFNQLVSDPRPPSLVRDTHYIVSNEDNHFVWRTSLEGRGGIFIGVGTDQNYVMAGWARPDLLVLMDFDQVVVDLHRVYGVIFLNSPTPHDFLDLWEDRNVRRVEELIEALKVDAPTKKGMLAAYRMAHFAVPRRLRRVESAYKPLGIRWFLNDINQYRYLVELFRTGRVVTVRGDLSVGGAMSAIANAAQKAGGVVRTLYLSNAERYFPYTAGFKKSIMALPTDEKSLVVRTRARMSGAYEYIIQDAGNFKRWLDWGKMTYAVELTRYRELDNATGSYFIKREPPSSHGKGNGNKSAASRIDAAPATPATPATVIPAGPATLRPTPPAPGPPPASVPASAAVPAASGPAGDAPRWEPARSEPEPAPQQGASAAAQPLTPRGPTAPSPTP